MVNNTYKAALGSIAESLVRGEIGILIGAGMSTESGVPAGSRMAKRMLRRAVFGPGTEDADDRPEFSTIDSLAAQYPFEAISRLLQEHHQYKSFAAWLQEKGGLRTAEASAAHKKLHELYVYQRHNFPRFLFTTNFDMLIEEAFGDEAIGVTTDNLHDLRKAREQNKVAVVHLHGSIDYPKSIIVGEGLLSHVEGPLFDLLRGALATEVFVLVGYSLADTNLRSVFFDVQRISETRFGLRKQTFVVSPAEGDSGDPATEAGLAQAIWAQRDVDHLPVRASTFFADLFDAVTDFLRIEVKDAVARALNVQTDTLDSMLRTAAEQFAIIEPFDLLVYLYYTLPPHGKKQ